MSHLLSNDEYYRHHGGKLPVKWSPPEVSVGRNGQIDF